MFNFHKMVLSDDANNALRECATYDPFGVSNASWTSGVSTLPFMIVQYKLLKSDDS